MPPTYLNNVSPYNILVGQDPVLNVIIGLEDRGHVVSVQELVE